MSSLWTIDGVLQLNSDGSLIYDISSAIEDCCCQCDLVYCIYERQLAAGLSGASLIDESCATYYTLAQLKTYVNNIAASFVNGTYTGGADAPTMLTNTYANSAVDMAALLVLVKAMLVTKTTCSMSIVSNKGAAIGSTDTCDNVKTAADAAYGTYALTYPEAASVIHKGHTQWGSCYGTEHYAGTFASSASYSATGMSTAIAHIMKVFVRPVKASPGYTGACPTVLSNTFSKEGRDIPDENMFGVVYTSGSVTDATISSGTLFADTQPSWPDCPGSVGKTNKGFYIPTATQFALITWDFTCL